MLAIYLMYALFSYQPATITDYHLAGNAILEVYTNNSKIITEKLILN